MNCPKCNEELFRKPSELDYVPPTGEWECLANISYIINQLLLKYPNTNFELNTKEFSSFMAVFTNEVMVSILLDERLMRKRGLGLNKIITEGFEFRGIKIRLIKN